MKRSHGERGAVWWSDGSPDHNRKLAKKTPNAARLDRAAYRLDEDSGS